MFIRNKDQPNMKQLTYIFFLILRMFDCTRTREGSFWPCSSGRQNFRNEYNSFPPKRSKTSKKIGHIGPPPAK